MDRTKAIEKLVGIRHMHDQRVFGAINDEEDEALGMAIEALEQAPTALDHIHNVVAEREYQRGYEQGKADAKAEAIPLDWIRGYINRLKDMGVVISIRDAQAVSVMVDKYMMEQNENATCGPDYCEIGGTDDKA